MRGSQVAWFAAGSHPAATTLLLRLQLLVLVLCGGGLLPAGATASMGCCRVLAVDVAHPIVAMEI